MNQRIDSIELVQKLEKTLNKVDFNFKRVIKDLGQVERSERRERGEEFVQNEHVKGMILALLSNQRPWGPIVRNMDKITDIFFNFDKDKIKKESKKHLARQLKDIKCGNRAIDKQMDCLDYNISILEEIEADYGSLDNYVISDEPINIAWELGQGRKYKIKQMGVTLALEYLRNVGIQAVKPDLHIRRIISNERLNLFDGYPSEIDAFELLKKIANESKVTLTYLDNLLWLYCAIDYGNICGSSPKCHVCELQNYCNGSEKYF